MRLYWRLLQYLRPHLLILIGAISFMGLYALFSGFSLTMIVPFTKIIFESGTEELAAGPQPEGGIVETVERMAKFDRATFLQIIGGTTRLEMLRNFCIILLLIFVIKNLFWYGQSFLIVRVEQGVIRDIRNTLYRHYHKLPLEYFHGSRTGDLISRITNDVILVRGAIANGLANLIRNSLLALMYVAMMVWASWQMTIATLVVLPPSVLLINKLSQYLRSRAARAQEKLATLTAILEETISGIRVVKAFGMEKAETEKFENVSGDYARRMIRVTRIGSLAIPLTETLGVAVGVGMLWYGGQKILVSQTLSPDRFFLFLLAAFSAMQPIKAVSNANMDIQLGLAAAKRIFHILDTRPTVRPPAKPRELSFPKQSIRFENVCFAYKNGPLVLRDINLEVKIGEVLAVVGPSGAGKTTLVDLVPRFYDPVKGKVMIDGIDIRDVDPTKLRSYLGIVTQETILFNDTVGNNIAYGSDGASLETIRNAAAVANASEFIEAMPQGYDTIIGDRGVKMSGGQRQRLAIARALLKNPPILIFDEATSALDSESEILVQRAIEKMMEGRTTFVIAHRLSTIKRADRIVVLDQGRIVESGTHDELLAKGGLYKKLYDMQFAL